MLLRFALLVLSILAASRFVQGVTVEGLYAASIAALLLVVCNVTIKPILTLLTLPISILTLGLFSVVINAGIFLFLASFIEGFTVDTFLAAIFGSIIVSVGNTIGGLLSAR